MMLGHEIFDPEIGKRVLVDHASIVADGEITKAARNWLGNPLDATKRRQVMFMDRDDILNLFVVTNLPLLAGVLPPSAPMDADELPFMTRKNCKGSAGLGCRLLCLVRFGRPPGAAAP